MTQRERILHEMLGKQVHIVVDRPIGYVHNGTVYPVNYGYIPGLTAGDGEAQDVYILGVSEPLTEFDGQIIGAIRRRDDVEDKLVAAPEGLRLHQGQIAQAVHFQEQYFDHTVDSLFRKSCGVLPWRQRTDGTREYLIVYEHYSQCWSLPKGHMEPGETEEMTALRELYEETGLTAVLDSRNRRSIEYREEREAARISAVIEYALSPIVTKQVVFFIGQVSGEPKARDGEIDAFRWVRAEDLSEYLFSDTAQACFQLIQPGIEP